MQAPAPAGASRNHRAVVVAPLRPPVAPAPPPAPAPAAAAPHPSYVEFGARRALIVAGVMLAALLQTVDATIVNVALPTIQGNLGATVDEATWIVTAYVVANVVVIPLTPWFQQRFGRKTYFLISIAGFTVASVLCGLADSLPELIAFRIVQGAFGGGLMATAQVILRDTFPAEQLGTSQAIYALGAVLGPSIGPTLGGILTDNLSWPWVFDVNIVPGILAFVLLLIFLRESPAKKIPVDVVGIVLLTVGIFSLQYVLDQGQREDWFSSQAICIATLTALGGLGAFTWWELTFERPIVDLRLLKTRAVAGASLIAAANAAGIFGVLLLLPQFSIEQLGFTSTLAGILIGLRAIPIALLTIPLGRLANSHWVDLRLMVGAGLAIQAAGTFWLSRIIGTDLTIGVIAPTLIVMGIGISLIFTPVLVAALRSVKPHDAPKAASFVTLSSQLGGSVFAALLVTIFERRAALHLDHLAAVVTPNSTVVQDFMRTHPLTELSAIVAGQAETIAYQDVFWVISIILAASVPLVLMIGRKKQSA